MKKKKKKKKKTKAPQRRTELDRIAAKVLTKLRGRTRNAIEIGNLLIESRKHLEHGEWQSWLAENFDLAYQTALNYVSAAEYVERKGKSQTVGHFDNLSPTVLYWLAAGHCGEQEEAAILAATRKGRVDQDAAWAIREKLAPPDDDDDDQDHGGDQGGETAAAEDPESAAILDGPPPAVPPPAPNPPPTDFAMRDFDEAISTLKQLQTRQSTQFARTIHSADDLEKVESFIRVVKEARKK